MAYHLKTRIAVAVSLLILCIMIMISLVAHSYFEEEFKAATFDFLSDSLAITAEGLSTRTHHALHTLELIRNSIPAEVIGDPRRMQDFLDGLASERLIFDNGLVLFSPAGQLLAVSPFQEDVVGMDFSFRDYIKVTLMNRQSYISAPIKSRQEHHHPIIMLTEPVFNDKDELIAILGGSFDLYGNNFLQTLINSKVGDNGFYMMLDQKETMIVHPDRENILRSASHFFPRAQIIEFLLNSRGLIPKVTIEGTDLIGAFQHVSPLNWTLVALTPLQESFQPIVKARTYTVMALSALSLLTLLIVRFMTNRLTSPLTDLTGKVSLLVHDVDTSVNLEDEPYEELGDLSKSIQTLVSDLTEKRQGLKEQLAFLQNLIDTIPGPIFYKDAEFKYLGCNSSFEAFIGIPRDELVGKSAFDIAPPDLAKTYHQADVDLWEKGGEQVYETSVMYADGSSHDVIFYKKLFNNQDGDPAGMIGTFLDITDRKTSEKALLASEKRFRLLVENAADAFFLHDEEGQILDVNQQACNSLGYSRNELLEKRVSDVSIHFDSKAVKKLQSEMTSGKIITIEDRHLRKEGSSFPVEVRLCYTEADGGLIIALARDISERKRVEAELQSVLAEAQAAKEQVDNILRCAADGLIVTDRRKRVTRINEIAEEILSVSAAKVVGQPFTILFKDQELREQAEKFLEEDGQNSHQLDFKINLSGRKFPRIVQARSSMLRDDSGYLSGVVTLLRDVSRERELDQIKSEFISTAAHEMRTPMSVIMGYIEMLTDSAQFGNFSPDKQKEFLREAYRKGEALAQIIDDLFDISRIEAGLPLPIDLNECDLNEILHGVTEHYAKYAPKHHFISRLADNAIVLADRNKMTQVFENLVSNAVKYSPTGGNITVRSIVQKETLRIDIEDEGHGMSSEQVDRVFDKFYRADSSNTAISGLGLGMSIVKTIIEGHGGHIRIESTAGRGTCVSVEIPCGKSPAA